MALGLTAGRLALGTGVVDATTIDFENLVNNVGQHYVEDGYEFLALGISEFHAPENATDRRLGTRNISVNGTADGVRMRRTDGRAFDLVSLNALQRFFPGEFFNNVYLSSIRTDDAFVEATIPSLTAIETTCTSSEIPALADFTDLPFLIITLTGGADPAQNRFSAQLVDDVVVRLAVPEPAGAAIGLAGLAGLGAIAASQRRASARSATR